MGGTYIKKYWNRTCGRSVSSSSLLSKLEVKIFVGQRASRTASKLEGFGECREDFVLSFWSLSVYSSVVCF